MPRLATLTLWWLGLLLTLYGGASNARAAEPLSPLDRVTEQLICDCGCSNLTVRNCTCGRADQVRADVTSRLQNGEKPDQILAAYVEEYGEQILAAPTRKGFNLVGWTLPFAAVLVGTALLVLVLRRWARVPHEEAPLVQPLGNGPPSPPDSTLLKKVEEEMKNRERS